MAGIVGKRTPADKAEQARSEKAFAETESKLDKEFLIRDLTRQMEEGRQRTAAAAAERKAKLAAEEERKARKADPLYDERKTARDQAEKGAVTKMVGGVKVTEYPAVDEVERRPTAQARGGRGESGAGSLLREMNPQKVYKKGGAVKSASARADGVAQRGKTRGRMV